MADPTEPKNGTEKKEKVLHARIPESLDDELRKRAGILGMSVSNLVRNILDNTIDLVEDVIVDSSRIARSARHKDGRARADGSAGSATVLAWQKAILNVNALCERCNGILPKGTEAAIGIPDGAGPRPVICLTCLEEPDHDEP